ncbi:MAG: thioredoxin family protein [Candidatus Izemoplasmatales bacterium]
MKSIANRLGCAFTFILFVMLLLSCVTNERINIDNAGANDFVAINSDQLANIIQSNDDFVVLISSNMCLSCDDFEPILKEIIINYEINVYRIEADDDFLKTNDIISYVYTPTFVIVSNGEIISKVNGFDQSSTFASETAFINYLDDYVIICKK